MKLIDILQSPTANNVYVFGKIKITKEREDCKTPLDIGAVTLICEGRNIILDGYKTVFYNEVADSDDELVCSKGSIVQFDTKCTLDLDTFPKDETFNYELTFEDLKSKHITGTFFMGDEVAEYEVLELSCQLEIDDKTYIVEIHDEYEQV